MRCWEQTTLLFVLCRGTYGLLIGFVLMEASLAALISVCIHAFSFHLDNYWLFLYFHVFFLTPLLWEYKASSIAMHTTACQSLKENREWIMYTSWVASLKCVCFKFEEHRVYRGDPKNISCLKKVFCPLFNTSPGPRGFQNIISSL